MQPYCHSKQRAFTLVELLIILAILFILAALCTPAFIKAKARAQRIRCVSHLKQIGLSYRQWALDNKDQYPMQVAVTNGGVRELIEAGYFESPFVVISNELNTPFILWCPADKRQRAAASFSTGFGASNVNYFVGLDADETQPQMFLAGDDNLLLNGQPVKRGIVELTTNSAVAYSGTRHVQQGNVGLSDGSVQGFSTSRFRDALHHTGTNVNRLAFP